MPQLHLNALTLVFISYVCSLFYYGTFLPQSYEPIIPFVEIEFSLLALSFIQSKCGYFEGSLGDKTI